MSIIVQTIGGLGNQLFQYAFARSVSDRLGTDFKLDISPFNTFYKDVNNPYVLERFNTKVTLAADSDMFGLVWLRGHNQLFNFLYNRLRLKYLMKKRYYHEKGFPFDPGVFPRDNIYFEGFWQTQKYFEHIAGPLRTELTLKDPLSALSAEMDGRIRKTVSVSIHVRRYADEAKIPWFGFCSVDYYERAAKLIREKVPNCVFYLFTDNHDWVRRNFQSFTYPYIAVENTSDKSHEDITLMSHCKHHIIANSSFSWWGAWLNPDPKKIVIAPKVWFEHAKKNDTRDLLPEEWVKI
ncbi:MAG: alpha-1,2-fucosyltransferase [Candidatus Taylorbacteria bacterium]|nr:alpha-1,2-fucosyltransferase [Candidatus Taylorbacteria bacterium]